MDVVRDVPTTAPWFQWWTLVRQDWQVRLEGLQLARELARLADESAEFSISMRSLADAVAAPDGAGHTRAAVERGMANLIERGWIVRLNPDAPRRERGRYRLGMPATVLMAGPGRDTPPGYTGLVGAPNAA